MPSAVKAPSALPRTSSAHSLKSMAAGKRSHSGWVARLPLLALFAALIVECLYVLVGSVGHPLRPWPEYTNDYDLLSAGFRAGKLHLLVLPPPELVSQANPFDPKNAALWIADESYYQGKYYLYWGPVPAVLQAIAKAALHIEREIGDQYLVFAFLSLSLASGAALIQRLRNRLFPGLSPGLVALAILAFGLANPALHLSASPGVYQAAISGGRAFLMLGLCLACDAVWVARSRSLSAWRCLVVGGAWGIALGCRVSLVFAVIALWFVTTLVVALRASGPEALTAAAATRGAGLRRFARHGFWFGVPLAVSVALLLYYNKLRFDDWLEFGTGVQLTTVKYRVALKYVPSNLYAYFLEPGRWSGVFPYLHQPRGVERVILNAWNERPAGYLLDEPVVGLLRAVPIVWLAPLGLAMAAYQACSRFWRPLGARGLTYLHYAASFAIIGSISGLPVFGLYLATMRYLGDFGNGVVLLGILAGFSLCAAASRARARRLFAASFAALALGTACLGLLLGYAGYDGHFEHRNPTLHAALVRRLSL